MRNSKLLGVAIIAKVWTQNKFEAAKTAEMKLCQSVSEDTFMVLLYSSVHYRPSANCQLVLPWIVRGSQRN